MPSVANVVGTNLNKYKVVKKGQFACNRMHVGRDYRLPIALSRDSEPFIVSPAYDVFEVVDTKKLDPEYLMMWFSRSEFDRNSWFYTDTDVRGKLGWDSFCDMELPVPSIEQQLEIVAEYNTVTNRIKLNERLNQKLEETAQALYKHWFVGFEFPNEEGQPYKSSGGAMVHNDELDKEIPEGWRSKPVYDIALYVNGGAFKNSDFIQDKSGTPIIKIAELKKGITDQTNYTNKKCKEEIRIKNGSLLYSWSGNPETSLEVFKWFGGNALLNQHIFNLHFNSDQSECLTYFTLKSLKSQFVQLAAGKQTTGLGHVTVADLKQLKIAYPSFEDLKKLEKYLRSYYNYDSKIKKENLILCDLQAVLLSKMSKVEENMNIEIVEN